MSTILKLDGLIGWGSGMLDFFPLEQYNAVNPKLVINQLTAGVFRRITKSLTGFLLPGQQTNRSSGQPGDSVLQYLQFMKTKRCWVDP